MRVRLVHLSAGSCDQCTKRGREQLPHVWGQGQKPGGPHAQRAAAKRSYPTSKVRGSSRECQAVMVQEQPRRTTQVRGQGWQPRRATLRPRSGAMTERSYPASEVRGSGLEELPQAPTPEARGGSVEELPHTWGQGQQLGWPRPRPRTSGWAGTGGVLLPLSMPSLSSDFAVPSKWGGIRPI